MPLEIRNRDLYLERTVQDWHRVAFGPTDDAIDLDLFGVCHRCRDPLYLIEGAGASLRKPTTILVRLAIRASVPAFLVSHSAGRVVGGRQVWPHLISYTSERQIRAALAALREEHECLLRS
jgi:hypothetical protein